MDNICGDYFRIRRFIGSKDRSDIAERVYNMMRAYARLGWWCDKTGLPDTARSRVLLTAILIDHKSADQISTLFNGNKYHPDNLSDLETKTVENIEGANLDAEDMPIAIQTECPDHALDKLQDIFGDEFETEMRAMLESATLDVRVNTIKADRNTVQTMLQKQDIHSDHTPYSPVGLRLKSKAYLSRTKPFLKGMIEIQDEGSQLLALICGARPGMQVLDYCAGGGGKTLALAADMQGKGRIVAMDIEERRLAKAKPRLTKAGVHNVELRPIMEDKHRKWFKRQKETFDVVLVDAPCTSSGTWRRNPDLRWNQYGPSAEEIEAMQADILERVWPTVKKGGRLVYATCSLFRSENEDQVETFLKNHPDFKVISVSQAWKDAGLETDSPVTGDYLRLSPARHQTDGFFAAILERAE
tara:strand:- start:5419 stop:6660 length:1242 start_codon:yes stop_codon:yes gene_type:complete